MRIEGSLTSVSWIPSEAVTGAFKIPFIAGMAHYDDPPPDELGDPSALANTDRCRFANQLRAFIDVSNGEIVGHGMLGSGVVGSTTLRLGGAALTFAPVIFPTLRSEPIVSTTSVKFTQTCGARTGVPAPRLVARPPYVQYSAPTAWTTLELELHLDGHSTGGLTGASPFPRHWVYDHQGRLFQKSALIDFRTWSNDYFGDHTPWGSSDAAVLVSSVETALERQLGTLIMRAGDRPEIRNLEPGVRLCRQGESGQELYLLLDGVLQVIVDDVPVAELGPGAVLGERALLEGGLRSSTLKALTQCRVAIVAGSDVDRDKLEQLARGHHRETTLQFE